jgi:glucose/arabinose dehydrogenase
LREDAARFTRGKALMTQLLDRWILVLVLLAAGVPVGAARGDEPQKIAGVLTGQDALGDWTTDAPGLRRKITIDDLAKPFETPSANNFPRPARRPAGAMPRAPKGFQVSEFAVSLRNPRKIVTAPNGDLFVAESMPNRIKILRDADGDGKAELNEVFATGLVQPFGIAFYPAGPNPTHIYVGNTNSVVRFPYHSGDTKASGPAEMLVSNIPSGRERVGA